MPLRLALLAALATVVITLSPAAERPNVLLIMVDDLKPSFGAYGDGWVHSPNLDRLAKTGMLFEQAYCNQAVCAPSRNHLLIGSRSTSTGIYSLGFHFRDAIPDAVTLPQHFKNHGYHAAGIGKVFHIGHGNINDELSWSVPFQPDKVIDYILPESTGGKLTREEAYFSNQKLGQIKSLPRGAAWERAPVEDDAYADGRIAREGIKRLRKYAKSEQPFFLALGFTKPHLPFCAPSRYWDLYDPDSLPLAEYTRPPAGAPSYAGKTIGELNQYKPVPENPPLTESLQRTLIHGYYASLSYMDAQVGLVLDELNRLTLDQNTIVVLWGDHGYHLGDHGTWTKHTNYEQANRIPVLVRAPGVTDPGTRSDALIETVDIYPTLVGLAGLPMPAGPQPIDGESLVPILADPDSEVRDHAYHCFPRGSRLGRAVRTERYRLVEWKSFGGEDPAEYELYDYRDDPQETQNLADQRPELVARLSEMLASHPPALPPARKAHSEHNSGSSSRSDRANAPSIANRRLLIDVECRSENPDGVIIAQGGRERGYALHFIDGRAAFDVRVNGRVTRLSAGKASEGKLRVRATLDTEQITLQVNDLPPRRIKSPGLISAQPKDGLSIGYDELSAAGDYDAPNPFNGTILSTRVTPAGELQTYPVAAPPNRQSIVDALRSHDRAVHVKSGWIRDPYIVLGPNDHYYLTGTTALPDDPRQQHDPYNTGLGDGSIVGWKMQLWQSDDLAEWRSLETPYDLLDGVWPELRPQAFRQVPPSRWRLWAPELHFIGDRWALVHTSPSPVRGANLSLSASGEIKGPWSNPLGKEIGRRHDPSLFEDDDGTWWLVWGATSIAPLRKDFSGLTNQPIQIRPSGATAKMGHEGCLLRKIDGQYVLFGTGWSTGEMRRGSYNLYYAVADEITGPYSERKFVGRFLGHGTPFQDRDGRWWSTAFFNANVPPLDRDGIRERDLSHTAQTINPLGTTLVPLDVHRGADGELVIRAKDPDYAQPGPDEAQQFDFGTQREN